MLAWSNQQQVMQEWQDLFLRLGLPQWQAQWFVRQGPEMCYYFFDTLFGPTHDRR